MILLNIVALICLYWKGVISNAVLPYQWRSGSALKAGRQVVPSSFPGLAYRPSRSEFSMVFSETRVNTN